MPTIRHHRAVQAIARRVLADLGQTITPDDSERSIAARATSMMERLGITATWYYDCPASRLNLTSVNWEANGALSMMTFFEADEKIAAI